MADIPDEDKAEESSEKKKTASYVCINKCYAGNRIWNPGDTSDGCDFSKNPNFELKK